MALVAISAGVMAISRIVLKPRSRAQASIKARRIKAWRLSMRAIATGQGGRVAARGYNCPRDRPVQRHVWPMCHPIRGSTLYLLIKSKKIII